jgi:hypothetical protein
MKNVCGSFQYLISSMAVLYLQFLSFKIGQFSLILSFLCLIEEFSDFEFSPEVSVITSRAAKRVGRVPFVG